ncbi:hypothetical protein K505DRAFT_71830 [Melanomma pulvis-pyrius CBS 109.77]|uniref:Uncharacterized protein n=1 Tax=Melanomma pulvis-pyrius CBS 109.77 TaxID=1314802 RepID=A0A6A6X4N4_9PLEO|nr:hypothetical protein K505DRAFT_71830 [Melanomma pulvis-pyrius CBS 109.77]
MGTSFALCARAHTSTKDGVEVEDDTVNNMQSQKHGHNPDEHPVFLFLQRFAPPQKDNDLEPLNDDYEAAPILLSTQALPRPDHDEDHETLEDDHASSSVTLSTQPQPLPEPDPDTNTCSSYSATTEPSTAACHIHVAIDMAKNPLGIPYGSTPPKPPLPHPSGWTPINAGNNDGAYAGERRGCPGRGGVAAGEKARLGRCRCVHVCGAIENLEVEVEDGWVLLPRLDMSDTWLRVGVRMV